MAHTSTTLARAYDTDPLDSEKNLDSALSAEYLASIRQKATKPLNVQSREMRRVLWV